MKKITSTLFLSVICMLFVNKICAQDGYTYTLIDNGSFSYSVGVVPNASSNNFATSVQSYGFTIILPDGVTASITSSLGSAANANFFNGDAIGDNSIDGYLITETLGSPISLNAPSTGMTNNVVTIQINGTPTSGSISILANDSSLANTITPLKSFMSADMIDDGMAVFPNVVDPNTAALSGTSQFNFVTLSTPEQEIIDFSIYPNPTTDKLHINRVKNLEKIEVINSNGQLVFTKNNELEDINVSKLQSGAYFLKIYTQNGIATKKFIKE
ncbi:T9SS type A sorting domain-containing protein [Kordia sp.]|uniref:T9SS type A sorting domain-containing protein n=1 Tax=Kordia sp. TaxID=1965332 RepID=UPI003B59DB66